jgi:hypothetical protein
VRFFFILGTLIITQPLLAQSNGEDSAIAIPESPPLVIEQKPDTTLTKGFAGCYFPQWKPGIDLQKFFSENIRIPDSIAWICFAGRVYMKVHVTKEGDIDSAIVFRGFKQPHLEPLNEEAIRLVKSLPKGAFVPVDGNTNPEPEWLSLPVSFDRL